jgi:Mg2+ and Co2+ transporter CorA
LTESMTNISGTRQRNWFGLICAYRLDGRGGGQAVGWPEIEAGWQCADRPCWVHLDLTHANALSWLTEQSGLDRMALAAMTPRRVGPRLAVRDQSLLLILSDIHFSLSALPTDIVGIRLWTDGVRILIPPRARACARWPALTAPWPADRDRAASAPWSSNWPMP